MKMHARNFALKLQYFANEIKTTTKSFDLNIQEHSLKASCRDAEFQRIFKLFKLSSSYLN